MPNPESGITNYKSRIHGRIWNRCGIDGRIWNPPLHIIHESRITNHESRIPPLLRLKIYLTHKTKKNIHIVST